MKLEMKQKRNLLLANEKEQLVDKILELENDQEHLNKKIHELEKTLDKKDTTISELQEKLKKYKEQLNRNSKNSSKPPSTDGFKKCKPTSERTKSEKKSGGQPGHEGVTLQAVENPDEIKTYAVDQCDACDADLSKVQVTGYIERQEVDIPPVKPIVTEHRMEIKTCPTCKTKNTAKCPEYLTQAIQYGPRIESLVAYLSHAQFIPLKRIQELCNDIFSLPISQGTLVNMHRNMYEQLEETEKAIKANLINSQTCSLDETSQRNMGKTQWLHSASTETDTFYFAHAKRGIEAMNAMGILPHYKGTAVHDHWKPYFTYKNVVHALCNAHHLRELRSMHENYNQNWAQEMREHLVLILKTVNEYKHNGKTRLTNELLKDFSDTYDAILKKGLSAIPTISTSESVKKRGRIKQHPAKNLHDRLTNFKMETLRFMYDFNVPFTNNLAERDIRMIKVKSKVSGTFRSAEGVAHFCRIRGYISTSRKRKLNIFSSLEKAARGQPEVFRN
jgi:transposase/uncharacterized coiled-coil protein SlyX